MNKVENFSLVYSRTLNSGTLVEITAGPATEPDCGPYEVMLCLNGEYHDDGFFDDPQEVIRCFVRGVEYFNRSENQDIAPGHCGSTFF